MFRVNTAARFRISASGRTRSALACFFGSGHGRVRQTWNGRQRKGRRPVAEKEFLEDRRRIQEEEYFQKQEQLLIAKLQQ